MYILKRRKIHFTFINSNAASMKEVILIKIKRAGEKLRCTLNAKTTDILPGDQGYEKIPEWSF